MKGIYFVLHNIFNQRAHSIQIVKTVEAINRRGVNLELAAPSFGSLKDLFKAYNLKSKFKINLLFNFGFNKMSKLQIVLFNFSAVCFLTKKAIKQKINFIYFRSELFFPLAVLAKLFLIPFFFEVHRSEKHERDRLIRNWLVKNAQGVVVITQDLKKHYSKLSKNIILAPCGFDADLFKPRQEKENDKIILGYTGSLEKNHGLDMIVEAVKDLDVKLVIVGGQQDDILRLKQKAGGNVEFVGRVQYAQLSDYLAKMDVLLLPQLRQDIGAVSTKMYEYMAMASPILASDIPANLAHLKENINAVFYESDNKKSFLEKLKQLIENRELREKMGQANLTASKEFSFSKRAEKIIFSSISKCNTLIK